MGSGSGEPRLWTRSKRSSHFRLHPSRRPRRTFRLGSERVAARVPREEFDAIMSEVGKGLMKGRLLPQGELRERVLAASELLNELGAVTEVVKEHGHFAILGHGCPLTAATAQYPEACNSLGSMLSEFTGHAVTTCCGRYERQRCCFEVVDGAQTGQAH